MEDRFLLGGVLHFSGWGSHVFSPQTGSRTFSSVFTGVRVRVFENPVTHTHKGDFCKLDSYSARTARYCL